MSFSHLSERPTSPKRATKGGRSTAAVGGDDEDKDAVNTAKLLQKKESEKRKGALDRENKADLWDSR
ncbi:hypothetical protein OPV22_006590 [Ensete ventricosum]|uniref:Uncharacterized protein n=1 Tax=Ensete ventricosum TaxID=4639 RepID=A0AAV8RNE9_ENSVE|nr:hypothetical protein OPV22_006590 [Ensete ventricosum]